MKSKLDLYEQAFVKSVKNALDELLETSQLHLPMNRVETNDFTIDGYSPNDGTLYTVVFYNADGVIIGYIDYEEGFGVTGYELADVEESMYYELAGCLLTWQAETLFKQIEGN